MEVGVIEVLLLILTGLVVIYCGIVILIVQETNYIKK